MDRGRLGKMKIKHSWMKHTESTYIVQEIPGCPVSICIQKRTFD